MRERERCCWCIRLSDGVLLIGIYGASFHAGLLVCQCTYGPTLTPAFPLDPSADDVVHPILVTVHVLGCIVNTLLGKKEEIFAQCASTTTKAGSQVVRASAVD